jgi:hypothetical protein
MIIIYPMLTSESVSPNILPGLVKTIEKYILVYNTDSLLKVAGGTSAGDIISTGAAITQTAIALAAGKDNRIEDVDPIVEDEKLIETSKLPAPPMSNKERLQKAADIAGKVGQSVKGVEDKMKNTPTRVDFPRGEAVSLEPTYIHITTKKKGLQVLGVKVIPFQVKSGENMADLLMQDAKLKKLESLQAIYGRKIARVFNRIMRKPYLSPSQNNPITGDPTKDVLYANTRHGENIFVCMSQLDLENSDFLKSPGTVQKLHKLGWASFVLTDDVNRRATFCMKEFNGMCSVLPYGFIYASLGKEHAKVYEDLEDVKGASSPFFNPRTNRFRAFRESLNIKSTTDKYLELIQK